MDVIIPNLGDIDEVEVIELCAAVGDVLAEDDAILVIESDKASMEIPSPAAGVLEALNVVVGDRVTEGHVIAHLKTDAAAAPAAKEDAALAVPEAESQQDKHVNANTQSETQPEATPPSTASSEVEVLVPDIGDATGVVIIEVAVKAGDEIAVDDLLVVLESDKASMEIAAEHAGMVVAVLVEEGQEVEEGTHIATLKVAGAPTAVTTEDAPAGTPSAEPEPSTATPSTALEAAQPPAAAVNLDAEPEVAAAAKVYAGPAVRRLARELGVQLVGIKGSGNRGRITKDDVKAFVKSRMQGESSTAASGGGLPAVPTVDFAKFGPVHMVELTRIRQRGAQNLHASWVNLPHVTQHDEADITDLEAFRQSLKQEAEQKGVKLTPLAFIVKACCHALTEHPYFNASLHADGQQLVVKEYINIGMAVDTPEGLVVPVIKAANQKNIWQLSAEIAELSDKARNKKLGMDDLQGGTFSVSSLGAMGGTGFTPIVNAPEVAILGVAKLATKPMWDGTEFVPRKMLPLSLSYDHRVINGADGGRFMMFLTAVLSDIRRLAL